MNFHRSLLLALVMVVALSTANANRADTPPTDKHKTPGQQNSDSADALESSNGHKTIAHKATHTAQDTSLQSKLASHNQASEGLHHRPYHSDTTDPEPCPHGCRCTSGPHIHSRHHWHRLLAQYRMRRLVYGGHGAGPRYRLHQQKYMPDEREMTCFGLTDMPDSVPSG